MRLLKSCYGLTLVLAVNTSFANSGCYQQADKTIDQLQQCMTLESLTTHLKAFQNHADLNHDIPGTRLMGTSGYNASRDYIIKKMTEAGYSVRLQNVPIEIEYISTPRIFEQIYPMQKTYSDNIDYTPLLNSGSGEIKASIQLPSGNISGCKVSDFIGFHPGNIALVEHGNSGICTIQTKVTNAVTAGAKAVIIYNNTTGIYYAAAAETPIFKSTPVLFATPEIANEFKTQILAGELPIVHIQFNSVKTFKQTQNIIADSINGDPDHIVVVGAHLDSSHGNAGLNDNASAAATILETALLMKNNKPINKLRFAWWTGEEEGLIGSNYYVNHLNTSEMTKISLYLNYEILGAPNGGRLIMGTADGITPPGSEQITQLYADYFKSQNLKYYIFDPNLGNAARRSDMLAFTQAGIPVGYLVTGAEIPWNPLFTAIFTDLPKRIEGTASHPCYHRLCDKLTSADHSLNDPNFDFNLYLQMSKAAAYAIHYYSLNTINPSQ